MPRPNDAIERNTMNRYLAIPIRAGALLLGAGQAEAHCDAIDGPVATTAAKALETGNLYPVLAYVPASPSGSRQRSSPRHGPCAVPALRRRSSQTGISWKPLCD